MKKKKNNKNNNTIEMFSSFVVTFMYFYMFFSLSISSWFLFSISICIFLAPFSDLKLDNILLDIDGHVRISDFGMCKLQIYLDQMAESFCGTPSYISPEMIMVWTLNMVKYIYTACVHCNRCSSSSNRSPSRRNTTLPTKWI